MYTRKEMIKFAKNNFEEIFENLGKAEQGSLLGHIAEVAVVKNRMAEGTDVPGSDMIENGLTKEIKSCYAYNTGYARWGNIMSKLNKCDTFVFVDGVSDTVYEVPHDVVIFEMIVTPAAGGEIRTTKHNLSILKNYEVSK